MKIYYVGNGSCVKGPAFLRLADNEYLEEGDICIVRIDTGTIAYLLTNDQHAWSVCRIIDTTSKTIDVELANCLIYSFNGFNCRKGNVSALEKLSKIFISSVMSSLFDEAIRVLKYQKDHMDATNLYKIYKKISENLSSSSLFERITISPHLDDLSRKKFFVSFLEQNIIEEIRPLIVNGMSAKDIITHIKIAYPWEFRKAFVEYNRDNPNGFIQEGLLEFFTRKQIVKGNKFEYEKSVKDKNYESIFLHFNLNKKGNEFSLHKAILLLAVMELVAKEEIVSPYIPLSKELEMTFNQLWDYYVPKAWGYKCAINYPFFFMSSECFWTLKPLPWHIEKTSYSLKDLKKNFYGAVIDKKLFEEFSNGEKRKKFIDILISCYINREGLIGGESQFGIEDIDLLATNSTDNNFVKLIAESKIDNIDKHQFPNVSRLKRKKTIQLPYGAKVKQIICDDFVITGVNNSSRMLYEFVEAVGVEKVYELRIPFLRGYLVDKTINLTYASNCKFFEGGFWLNTTGSLAKKVELIQYIADCLKIKITIELQNSK